MHNYEAEACAKGFDIVIGIDEAGRGPLAGPVVSSAVHLKSHQFSCRINDSKKLSESQREKAFEEICAHSVYGVGMADEKIIDQINILEATFVAMNKAVEDLLSKMNMDWRTDQVFHKRVCLLIDGNRFKTKLPFAFETIVKGDSLVPAISCASIIAKVTRDRMMLEYDKIYPEYGFKGHKGYPTVEHKAAVRKFGFSPIHRRTFKI
ncbi:MAG: ribonuclease HII [Candidatus Omnitrophica bacterium]|nr:ribonuclease HII [Candidatus Omnitrophota bacterium]